MGLAFNLLYEWQVADLGHRYIEITEHAKDVLERSPGAPAQLGGLKK